MSSRPELRQLFFSRTNDFLHVFLLKQTRRSRETVKAYRISLNDFYTYVTEVIGKNVMKFQFTDCTYESI